MSSQSCGPSLRVELRPSRWLLLGGGVSHFLAGIAVVGSAIPWWARSSFLIAIVLSGIRFGYGYGYPRGRRFVAIIEWLDGRWRLEMGNGEIYHGQVEGGYAHPGMLIVNFRLDGGQRRSVMLLPDTADSEELRRVRVWLRTQSAALHLPTGKGG